jgi:hypothetical protein
MKNTIQPTVNELVETIYQNLVKIVCSNEFPRKFVDIETRMIDYHKEAVISGEIIDPDTKVVSVNLARAGTFPSHVCYGALNYFLNPHHVRQDHIILSREIDEQNRVVGTNVYGSKIGGSVDEAIVLIQTQWVQLAEQSLKQLICTKEKNLELQKLLQCT